MPGKSTKKSTKRGPQGLCWGWTWNNYDLSDVTEFLEKLDQCPEVKYICQEEVAPETGTPHIQGFIMANLRIRPIERFQKWYPKGAIHWGDKFGKPTSEKDWVRSANYCRKNDRGYMGGIRWKTARWMIPMPLVLMTKDLLRPEQLAMTEWFSEYEDPLFGRKVYWFWEPDGNWGKSVTCKYMIDQMDAMVVQGANKDILCGVTKWIEDKGCAPPIIIFDVPRVAKGHVSYQAIEALKNGFFFSGKYESGMCRFNSPHVIVCANIPPETEFLSEDRWIIHDLRDTFIMNSPAAPEIEDEAPAGLEDTMSIVSFNSEQEI